MYYHVRGELILLTSNMAVVDCGGVGYQLSVSGQTLGRLADKRGEQVTLFTHLSVREDAMELFGFHSQEELSAFRMLISVSGVGPKAAMAILGLFSPERFALAVTTGDAKGLAKAPGVGAKTAARIILELKDKIAREIKSEGGTISLAAEDSTLPPAGGNTETALQALMVLGYSRPDAAGAVSKIDTDSLSVDDIIREALKLLMKG